MKKPERDVEPDPATEGCITFGWTAVAVFLLGGLLLESFHLMKLPFYLEARLRRELWTLAHAHGTLLGLVNVAFGLTARSAVSDAGRRLVLSKSLRVGSVLVPAGFFLGGIGNAEGDPSLAILLVPLGAALVLAAVAAVAVGRLRGGRL
jgi:hypothetical protein